jgi:hypothetical protein
MPGLIFIMKRECKLIVKLKTVISFMKPLRIVLPALFSIITLLSFAQTTPSISDEELKKYAQTMDSVKVMQQTLTQIITENVQKNTVMTVVRYNQLFKIVNDQAQLTAANATAEEIAFLKEIADLRQLNIDRINTTYQALAKEYVGLKAFNAIKKSLETDPSLKARYEGITQELQSSGQSPVNKGK